MEWIENRYLLTEFFKKTKFSQYFGFPVKDIIKLCRFHRGEQIIESDILSDFIYFLLDGEVKFLVTSDSGKIIYLGGSKEFTVLGEVSSLWKMKPMTSVVASSDCLCFCISLDTYRNRLLDDNTFLRYISKTMAYRLTKRDDDVIVDKTETAYTKMCALIIQNSQDTMFTLDLQECARTLSISYRQVIRVMNRLLQEKLIKKVKKKYYILNYSALYANTNDNYFFYE